MVETNTSSYPTGANYIQPPNALTTIGQYAGVANALAENKLIQQHIQQSQMNTQIMQGRQRLGEIISKNQRPDGSVDPLGVMSDAAKDPLASHPQVFSEAQNWANDQLQATPAGLGNDNAPQSMSKQAVNQRLGGGGTAPQQPQTQPEPQPGESGASQAVPPVAAPQPPALRMGLPPGYNENLTSLQQHYQQVRNEANSVPQENAVLNNILNISKSGAPTGTLIGQMYQKLASTGMVPQGVSDIGAQLKTIQNHVSQLALSGGMPGSDARLEALENSKVGSTDLPQTLQTMIPYLLAVNKSKVARAQYYAHQDPTGMNPQKIQTAQANWSANTDPRVLEYNGLPDNEKKKYVSALSPEDAKELSQKRRVMKVMGVE